jgi:hypothetical protein
MLVCNIELGSLISRENQCTLQISSITCWHCDLLTPVGDILHDNAYPCWAIIYYIKSTLQVTLEKNKLLFMFLGVAFSNN